MAEVFAGRPACRIGLCGDRSVRKQKWREGKKAKERERKKTYKDAEKLPRKLLVNMSQKAL